MLWGVLLVKDLSKQDVCEPPRVDRFSKGPFYSVNNKKIISKISFNQNATAKTRKEANEELITMLLLQAVEITITEMRASK